MKKKRRLTPKQQLFVTEYIKRLNATEAARRAGYSARNADKIAYLLLEKPRVREAIQEPRTIWVKMSRPWFRPKSWPLPPKIHRRPLMFYPFGIPVVSPHTKRG